MPGTINRRIALAAGLALPGMRFPRPGYAQLGPLAEDDPLAWLPELPGDPASLPVSIATHADIARYWEARGIDRPTTLDVEGAFDLLMEQGQQIPTNDGVMDRYLQMDWYEIAGFSFWDVDQLTVANDPPEQLRIYQGRFDLDLITERLGSAGYEIGADGDFVIMTNPNEELDPSTDLGRFTLGNFNHVAASETLVIASRSMDAVRSALAAGTGDAPSLADQESYADVTAVLGEMTGYMLLNGSLLGPEGRRGAAPESGELLPPASTFVAGISMDEHGQAVSLIADLDDPDVAEQAVDVVAANIETGVSAISGQPYADELGEYDVDVVPGTSMVRVTVTSDEFATRWIRYVYAPDLIFMATE